ncbi:hypothetical protein AYI69_g9527 [Smittium culicis]|uniref:Uncharacterized protein n=1 Tax=Smittium culicis TaxID=133412 RepID=A0A1R1XC13_9FUNG|nr:hypothetical protein AYI69_g9527 [Smittium culicis]
MISIPGDILNPGLTIWIAQCGSFRFKPEQESGQIFQLVPGNRITRTECTGLHIVRVHHPLRVPTLESDISGDPEGPQRTTHDHTSNSNVEVRNMVSGSDRTFCCSTVANSSENSDYGSIKRKIAVLGQQALELDSLDDRW